MTETETQGRVQERAVLCGLDTGRRGEYSSEESLRELAELADTAGAEVFATVVQQKSEPDTATLLGSGKLDEVAQICRANSVGLLIFDDELTGTQIRNIEERTHVRVIDRTALILDIFAARARSREGRLQVELAQLRYLLPRLTGFGGDLSRLGGGIGTRGPGESKLETDRRHIRRRIEALSRSLAEVAHRRGLLRSRREKDGIRTAAIVGYTNAGKSTLLNALTGADVLAEDKLFATLDPTARGLTLPDGREILLIDTVGFIRKLPARLVEAFHSTLEEAAAADLILNVCDASDPQARAQLAVSDGILEELGCVGTPQLLVLNKSDRAADGGFAPPPGREWVSVSAATGMGFDRLTAAVARLLPNRRKPVHLLVPYADGGAVEALRRYGILRRSEYTPEGILVEGEIDEDRSGLVERYRV